MGMSFIRDGRCSDWCWLIVQSLHISIEVTPFQISKGRINLQIHDKFLLIVNVSIIFFMQPYLHDFLYYYYNNNLYFILHILYIRPFGQIWLKMMATIAIETYVPMRCVSTHRIGVKIWPLLWPWFSSWIISSIWLKHITKLPLTSLILSILLYPLQFFHRFS